MKVFGTYQVFEGLSSDEFGSVFRGRDPELEQAAVIKVFSSVGMTPAVKQQFCREVLAASKLDHPNVVSAYAFGEQEDSIFLAQEEVNGENLRQFIDRRGELTLEAKLQFMIETCEGLAYAHASGVIHGDLRPANIIVLKSGRPKMVNFAIARAFTVDSSPTGALGSTVYMAPEQMSGRLRRGNEHSDIYSVSVIFFELLTYRRPIEGTNVVAQVLRSTPPLLTEINPALPERLAALLARGLSRNPIHRFQTASQYADALRVLRPEVAETSKRMAEALGGQVSDQIPSLTRQLKKASVEDGPAAPGQRACPACGVANHPEAVRCQACSTRLPQNRFPLAESQSRLKAGVIVPPPIAEPATSQWPPKVVIGVTVVVVAILIGVISLLVDRKTDTLTADAETRLTVAEGTLKEAVGAGDYRIVDSVVNEILQMKLSSIRGKVILKAAAELKESSRKQQQAEEILTKAKETLLAARTKDQNNEWTQIDHDQLIQDLRSVEGIQLDTPRGVQIQAEAKNLIANVPPPSDPDRMLRQALERALMKFNQAKQPPNKELFQEVADDCDDILRQYPDTTFKPQIRKLKEDALAWLGIL